MGTDQDSASEQLRKLLREIRQWRKSRKAGSRIPEWIWEKAARIAITEGITPTSQALGIDCARLRRRTMRVAPEAKQNEKPAFVELDLSQLEQRQAPQIKIANGTGGELLIHGGPLSVGDLERLISSFLGHST